VVARPLIASQTQPSNLQILYGSSFTLSARATDTGSCSFPIAFHRFLNSNVIYSAMNGTNYTITSAANPNAGAFSLLGTPILGRVFVTGPWPVARRVFNGSAAA